MTDQFSAWIYTDFNLGPDANGKARKFTLSRKSMVEKHIYLLDKMHYAYKETLNYRAIDIAKPISSQKLIYESHMILEDELKKGELRLLEVDY